MTEEQWSACADPDAMLDFVRRGASERKLRLFACACGRRVWHLLPDELSRRVVAVAERFAEGLAGEAELSAARVAAQHTVWGCARETAWDAARDASHSAGFAAGWAAEYHQRATVPLSPMAFRAMRGDAAAPIYEAFPWDEGRSAALQAQAEVLRCIFGSPFRPLSPRAFPAHVVELARECDAAFPPVSNRFAILADALTDLDEEGAALHCREAEHAKGCHVLDVILRRE